MGQVTGCFYDEDKNFIGEFDFYMEDDARRPPEVLFLNEAYYRLVDMQQGASIGYKHIYQKSVFQSLGAAPKEVFRYRPTAPGSWEEFALNHSQ